MTVRMPTLKAALLALTLLCLAAAVHAQSFGTSNLDFAGLGSVNLTTGMAFGPDGRLYVIQVDGRIDILEIQRNGLDDYEVIGAEELLFVKNIPNHDDDGSADTGTNREAIGIAVGGTAANPVFYVTSSDARVGGPSGDTDLDTNSGVITRLSWVGVDRDDPLGSWAVVDIVRALPRSEENHATNSLEIVTVASNDYLIVASGGHTNAGSPSTNFAWHTEYALSAAILSVDLTAIEALPILNDGVRDYIYDLPTVDDPTRANVNGITDPDDGGYDGVDVNDPWGGNDGLNQAKLVAGGPVQIFSPGYRNSYDLVITAAGRVYVTENGANGGWGGFPENEGLGGNTTNNYRVGEPGSTGPDAVNGDPQVNNKDHLHLITTDINTYVWGSYYGGHPSPIRSNPAGAGLFTRGTHSSDPGDSNGNTYTDDWFRTIPYDPSGSGDETDPQRALPADWPPVPLGMANSIEGDYRNPDSSNPDGPVDDLLTIVQNNSNGIDEYSASNFGGAMQGDLIVGRSGGNLHRIELLPDGSYDTRTENWVSGIGGNSLAVVANGDSDPFPGTIWVGTFNTNIVILEPQDFVICIAPGEPGYDPNIDGDLDGYINQDEEDNFSDPCNGASQPGDHDKPAGGSPLVSDLNDTDDDADGITDDLDPMQIGDPVDAGSDAFPLPVTNELFSDNPTLQGYLGLGFSGLMNNGDPNPNWLLWLDETGAGPNPNDVLGGAVGAMTMQMTEGTALGATNTQEKGFQYGVQVDLGTGPFKVSAGMLNFGAGLQLYPFAGDGELGIFLGDGTQSNYIQIVIDDAGIEVLQELADVPQTPLSAAIAVIDRPTTGVEFVLEVDPASGDVAALYSLDGAPFVSLGTLTAGGAVLQAIQQASIPLMVGLIGSSNTPGAEVEGTWDYLNVAGSQPTVSQTLPDFLEPAGAPSQVIDLDLYFDDDEGPGNLTYTIESISNPAFGASLVGGMLTITFPAFGASGTITIRATDSDTYFVEQTFMVETSTATPIYRVNAGGPLVAAIDGGIDWAEDTTLNNSAYLAEPGGNKASAFSIPSFTPQVDLVTTPTAIFQTERWASIVGGSVPSMSYDFPIAQAGSYEVRLYMANGWSGSSGPGQRVFDVEIEQTAYPDLTGVDLSGTYGHQVGAVISHVVNVTDGLLEIDFQHGSANNPLVNGIEIIGGGGGGGPVPITVTPLGNQASQEGALINLPVIAGGGDTGTFAFSALNLPTGLQIEPTSGLIFGTIAAGAASGSVYSASVTVDDNDGDGTDMVTIFFDWTVAAPGGSPVWIDLAEDETYTARHECSFVQAGDKFILFGGRENPTDLDTYDYASDTWTLSASAPQNFNHFQATEYQGLVWVIGAFKENTFPSEPPAENVYAFDPANDAWMQGPVIPVARRRGGGGLVVYNDKFYLVGGNTIGHNGGYVPWFDEFDPHTGTWTQLTDAPHARDHFHAAMFGDKLYAIGGRLSGGAGGTFAPLVPEVDVYDFNTSTWSTLPVGKNLPTPRAAASIAVFDGKILVIGGETDPNPTAFDTVEAYDPVADTWSTLDSLNHARHGTQAIVSGQGVYVAAGSPNRGGGQQKNMEVYNADLPAGTASTVGVLNAPLNVPIAPGTPETISLTHVAGNEGIYVESVAISGVDAADFALTTPIPDPFLIATSGLRDVEVEYTGAGPSGTASLDVTYSGGLTTNVMLLPEPGAAASLCAGVLSLLWLSRRRARRGDTEG